MKRLAVIEAIESILNDRWDKEGPTSEGGRKHIFKKLEVIHEFLNTSKKQMVVNCKDCIHAEKIKLWSRRDGRFRVIATEVHLKCGVLLDDSGPPDDGEAGIENNGYMDECNAMLVSPSFGCVMGEEEEEEDGLNCGCECGCYCD